MGKLFSNKYGITLRERSYYNSAEDSVWNYFGNEQFQQIIGIGKDEYFGLNQKQSITSDKKIIFGTENRVENNRDNRTQIEDLQFILLGIDTLEFNNRTEIDLENGFTLIKYGNFRIQKIGTQEINTFLEIDCSNLDIEAENFQNLRLLINRNEESNFYFCLALLTHIAAKPAKNQKVFNKMRKFSTKTQFFQCRKNATH